MSLNADRNIIILTKKAKKDTKNLKQKYHLTSSIARVTNHQNMPEIGPSGQSIPAQVTQVADGVFKADFVPRSVGKIQFSLYKLLYRTKFNECSFLLL